MRRLLIVEDDPITSRAFAACFRRWFDVDEAPDLATARRLLSSRAYDRALIDVRLPDGDGLELVAFLRSLGLRFPVLVVSGLADRDLPERAYVRGASFAYKPPSTETLEHFATLPASLAPVEIARRYAETVSLTPRQTEVLEQVVAGTRPSKLPAALGVQKGTVKAHTRSLLRKTGASSLDDLRELVLRAEEPSTDT